MTSLRDAGFELVRVRDNCDLPLGVSRSSEMERIDEANTWLRRMLWLKRRSQRFQVMVDAVVQRDFLCHYTDLYCVLTLRYVRARMLPNGQYPFSFLMVIRLV